jgi:hypothetical protein
VTPDGGSYVYQYHHKASQLYVVEEPELRLIDRQPSWRLGLCGERRNVARLTHRWQGAAAHRAWNLCSVYTRDSETQGESNESM